MPNLAKGNYVFSAIIDNSSKKRKKNSLPAAYRLTLLLKHAASAHIAVFRHVFIGSIGSIMDV